MRMTDVKEGALLGSFQKGCDEHDLPLTLGQMPHPQNHYVSGIVPMGCLLDSLGLKNAERLRNKLGIESVSF